MVMKILVVGAGAVGGYFGGRMAQSGAEVAVVCRSDYAAIKQRGYAVKSIDGDFHFTPSGVYREVRDYPDCADLVLIATKALPEIDLAELIRPAVKKNTVVLLIQNGIDVEEPLVKAFPDNELLSAIAYIGVSRFTPGEISHQGAGRIRVGVYPPKQQSAKLNEFAELCHRAKICCETVRDIVQTRWEKLVWNAPFNPISILAGGIDTRQIMNDQYLVELSAAIMHEVCIVAEACGKRLPKDIIERNLEYTRNFPPYKTSMLLDYENGRKIEVEAIVGNILRNAGKHNLAVPQLHTIYALLRAVNDNIQ
jgi:2-dehydropantoate 2-reductase